MSGLLEEALRAQDVLILDGGLATELQARGHDLDHPLWSARLLLSDPDAIRAVHQAYAEAGADCLITASYQASIAGFAPLGIGLRRAAELLRASVRLAVEARAAAALGPGRLRPLIAASVGPYGAALADGSEYRGEYGLAASVLSDFHAPRWEVLADAGADLLACETIPSVVEAEVLLRLLEQTPQVEAWLSFSCRDERSISDGTPVETVAALVRGAPQPAAVGFNCTAPALIEPLIRRLAAVLDERPIVVYPNSGERYDAASKSWTGTAHAEPFAAAARRWRRAGARLIGGCCRTGPEHIRALRRALLA